MKYEFRYKITILLTVFLLLQFLAWGHNINYESHVCSRKHLVVRLTAVASSHSPGHGPALVAGCGDLSQKKITINDAKYYVRDIDLTV